MADHRELIRPFGERIVTGTSDSILASIFREIIYDLGIDIQRFNTLIAKYIIRANIPVNLKEVSSTRGNLKKELLRSVMTWKVFIKGLLFLNVKKFEIVIKLHHANGKTTHHSKTISLDDVSLTDEEVIESETDV